MIPQIQPEALVNLFNEHIIKLESLKITPLSSQLSRITGDPFCCQDFVNENGVGLNAESKTIIVHKHTGIKFLIP